MDHYFIEMLTWLFCKHGAFFNLLFKLATHSAAALAFMNFDIVIIFGMD